MLGRTCAFPAPRRSCTVLYVFSLLRPLTMLDRQMFELKIPLRLAVASSRGLLIVPLWFEARAGHLWCASQSDSWLLRSLRAEPNCAFDLSTNDMPYRGLRGRGAVICHPQRGEEMLRALLMRYLGTLEAPLARRLLRRAASEVAIEIVPQWQSDWDFTRRMQNSLPAAAV